jgi:hypothetical protein
MFCETFAANRKPFGAFAQKISVDGPGYRE